MNVYDFDKTIYKKDCSVEFYKFVVKKKPSLLLKCMPGQLGAIVRYKCGKISKELMKEKYFSFLQYIDVDSFLKKFVDQEIMNIAEWYQTIKRNDDVVISASPEFLVRAFADRLGIEHVLATEVDKHTGKFRGKNCRGQEKVVRFDRAFSEQVDNFYSDSLSDLPMAKKAHLAYLVKKGTPVLWEI